MLDCPFSESIIDGTRPVRMHANSQDGRRRHCPNVTTPMRDRLSSRLDGRVYHEIPLNLSPTMRKHPWHLRLALPEFMINGQLRPFFGGHKATSD
jgi:hypothetical protein